jgi:hypothetical protein
LSPLLNESSRFRPSASSILARYSFVSVIQGLVHTGLLI